jgi:hypothetical protein
LSEFPLIIEIIQKHLSFLLVELDELVARVAQLVHSEDLGLNVIGTLQEASF